jgi:hypothetical protein
MPVKTTEKGLEKRGHFFNPPPTKRLGHDKYLEEKTLTRSRYPAPCTQFYGSTENREDTFSTAFYTVKC